MRFVPKNECRSSCKGCIHSMFIALIVDKWILFVKVWLLIYCGTGIYAIIVQ